MKVKSLLSTKGCTVMAANQIRLLTLKSVMWASTSRSNSPINDSDAQIHSKNMCIYFKQEHYLAAPSGEIFPKICSHVTPRQRKAVNTLTYLVDLVPWFLYLAIAHSRVHVVGNSSPLFLLRVDLYSRCVQIAEVEEQFEFNAKEIELTRQQLKVRLRFPYLHPNHSRNAVTACH